MGSRAASAEAAKIELVLYITGTSPQSQAALSNLQRALRSVASGELSLVVYDVAQHFWSRDIDEDGVSVTPTLIRRRPLPRVHLVGDLSDADGLEALLRAGGRPPGAG